MAKVDNNQIMGMPLKTYIEKALFLDIDGVLNCYFSRTFYGKYRFVDDDKIQRLKAIVDGTGADIILSSTWRMLYHPNEEQCDDMFLALEGRLALFGLTIVDLTPRIPSAYRGTEINLWLDDHPECKSICILDDDRDMEPYLDRLVCTTYSKGLQDYNVIDAINILNTPYTKRKSQFWY